jgi:WD40 repeat protein
MTRPHPTRDPSTHPPPPNPTATNPARLGRAILTSNNDSHVRVFDAATLALRARLAFPWAVNFASLRPDAGAPGCNPTAAVVGDDPVVSIVDLSSSQTVMRLGGHRDFAFAAAWHPGGQLLATGNQDGTTMVWDVRAPGRALSVLGGRLGAVRALRWSPDGG